MNFKEALEALSNGSRVKKANWGNTYLKLSNSNTGWRVKPKTSILYIDKDNLNCPAGTRIEVTYDIKKVCNNKETNFVMEKDEIQDKSKWELA